MKKHVFVLLLLCAGLVLHAQKEKISIDDDTIQVNGKAYGVLEKKSGMPFSYTLKSLDGKEQAFVQLLDYYDPAEVNSSNPKGRVTYYEFTFFGSGEKCEVAGVLKKNLAKLIVENHLLLANGIDAEAEKKFVMIYGTKFSERKKALEGPKVIIIQQ